MNQSEIQVRLHAIMSQRPGGTGFTWEQVRPVLPFKTGDVVVPITPIANRFEHPHKIVNIEWKGIHDGEYRFMFWTESTEPLPGEIDPDSDKAMEWHYLREDGFPIREAHLFRKVEP